MIDKKNNQFRRSMGRFLPRAAKVAIVVGFRRVRNLVYALWFLVFGRRKIRTIDSVLFRNNFSSRTNVEAFELKRNSRFFQGVNVFYVGASRGARYLDFLLAVVGAPQNYIVFKNKNDYQNFKNLASDRKASGRILWISGIDAELDEDVYKSSRALSSEFVDELCCSLSELNLDEIFVNSFQSLDLAVCDRFQSWVRNALYLKKLISDKRATNFYSVGDSLSNEDLITFLLGADGVSSSLVNGDSYFSGPITLKKFINRKWDTEGNSNSSVFDIKGVLREGEDFVIYSGILTDELYRETASLVLRELVDKIKCKVLFIPSSYGFQDFDIKGVSVVKKVDRPLPDSDKIVFLQALDQAFSRFVRGSDGFFDDSFFSVLRLYLISNLHRSLFRLFADCYSFTEELRAVSKVNQLKGVICNPGRLWFSQVLTAQYFRQPSFEIQCGTLTKSLRYKAPTSQYMLAVDDVSKDVYCNYLGVGEDSVYVVGAPRIDAKLVDIREVSPSRSRAKLELPVGGKILCVATQPYGKEFMSSMVKESARILTTSNEDWFLVVSMHPNETSEYKAGYEQVLSEYFETGRACISQGEIYHCLNAADSVVTYFSTSGLEAFCLKKRVFSFRPREQESVPFDLCKLGVAEPFSDGHELLALLSEGRSDRPLTQGLRNLQDGRSVSRICNFIAERI